MNKVYINLIFCILYLSQSYAQPNTYSQKIYSVKELQSDFKIFRYSLENIQPSLYRYTSEYEMDHYLDHVYNSINKPMTELEFYRCLMSVIAKLSNGHSRIIPSEAYLNYSKENIKKFPFKIEIYDQHAYIVENYSFDSSIVKGSEILSINGIPFYTIYSQITPLLTRDGYSLAFTHAKLALDFSFHYSTFYTAKDSFSLELLLPNKRSTVTKSVNALFEKDIESIKSNKYDMKNKNKDFNLEITKDSIGILTIKNFWDKNFKLFIDKAFNDINMYKAKYLIIDLRDNGGGNDDNGVYLYSYLCNTSYDYYSLMETQLEPNQGSIPYIKHFTRPETLMELVKVISKNKNGKNVILNPDTTIGFVIPGRTHKPKQNSFNGDVYILINGLSFSVTSDFCAIAHKNERAKFIGSETGGGYYGNTSGYSCHLILPNTQLDVRLNLIEYKNAVEDSNYPYGRGVLPDFEVHPKALDICNGIDTEMEYTLDLIRINK